MPSILTATQTTEFNDKGFTYARGLFAPDEVKLLTRAMEEDPAVRDMRRRGSRGAGAVASAVRGPGLALRGAPFP